MERIEIPTDRLLLRPWRFEDLQDAYQYGSDPEWGRYLWFVPQPYSLRDAEQFIARAVLDPWQDQEQFAIELNNRVIGGVHLYLTDPHGMVAGLGYNVSRTHWGKGIATEAAGAVLKHGFSHLGLHKIVSSADARNTASTRVMAKLGMTQEAYLRLHRYYRGEYADEVQFSLLKEEIT